LFSAVELQEIILVFILVSIFVKFKLRL